MTSTPQFPPFTPPAGPMEKIASPTAVDSHSQSPTQTHSRTTRSQEQTPDLSTGSSSSANRTGSGGNSGANSGVQSKEKGLRRQSVVMQDESFTMSDDEDGIGEEMEHVTPNTPRVRRASSGKKRLTRSRQRSLRSHLKLQDRSADQDPSPPPEEDSMIRQDAEDEDEQQDKTINDISDEDDFANADDDDFGYDDDYDMDDEEFMDSDKDESGMMSDSGESMFSFQASDEDPQTHLSEDPTAAGSSPGTSTSHRQESSSRGSKRLSADDNVAQVEFSILSLEQIQSFQDSETMQVSSILGIKPRFAKTLLKSLKWNKERLLETYFDNAVKVLTTAGIITNDLGDPVEVPSSARPADGTCCDICCDEVEKADDWISPPCGHWYCRDCWKQYLETQIMSTGGARVISCMAHKCPLTVDDVSLRAMVSEDMFQRYKDMCTRNYVDQKDKLRWCPAPNCVNCAECHIQVPQEAFSIKQPKPIPTDRPDDRWSSAGSKKSRDNAAAGTTPSRKTKSKKAEKAEEPDPPVQELKNSETDDFPFPRLVIPTVKCSCNQVFCFSCGEPEGHSPCICPLLKLWHKKCADDSETTNWIMAHTKECPKCHTTIEKNGGCNHMVCRKCQNEFCWVCLGSWADHGNSWYNCNRFDEDGSTRARDAQARSRASLERYLHYYNRYMNHEQSARLDAQVWSQVEAKMEEMQTSSDFSWIQVQFLKSAFAKVVACRGTLKYTYSFAYYLARGNNKVLFEDNQRNLETAVEDLSELLEKPLPKTMEELAQYRGKVMDKATYVESRRQIVVNDTEQGLLERRWTYNVPI